MSKKEPNTTIGVNKKAEFNYFLEERIEAGLSLQGWEVKSVRAGKIQVVDAYVLLKKEEAFLIGMQITPLSSTSTHFLADPARTRKLLMHRKEINRLIGLSERSGYAIVLTKLYWKGDKIKCQIAIGKGKKEHDKRETVKQREWQREKGRILRKN
jgi:SsrA-binding protein